MSNATMPITKMEYSSHLALLATLAKIVSREIVHIVELGCGLYSTPMWLNCSIWPFVHSVNSYEHNPQWLRHVGYITRDPRLTLMDEYPLAVDYADLVFIDNGDNRQQRLTGIEYVVKYKPTGLVILHDANEQTYMQAIEPHFDNCLVYTGAYPHTAILWNGNRFDYTEIKASFSITETYECL